MEPRRCRFNLLHSCALLHGVEHTLGTRFGAEPHGPAASPTKGAGNCGCELVGPQQTFEGNCGVALLDLVREPLDPPRLESEDVVGDPDVIRPAGLFQQRELARDTFRRPGGITLAVDWLCAPVAVERTSTCRHDVCRKVAVVRLPDGTIPIEIDEIASRQRQRVEFADELPRGRPYVASLGVAVAQP